MGDYYTVTCNTPVGADFYYSLTPGEYIVVIKQEADCLYVYFNWLDSSASTQQIPMYRGEYYATGLTTDATGFDACLYLMYDWDTTICAIHEGDPRNIIGQELRYYQPYDYDAIRGI